MRPEERRLGDWHTANSCLILEEMGVTGRCSRSNFLLGARWRSIARRGGSTSTINRSKEGFSCLENCRKGGPSLVPGNLQGIADDGGAAEGKGWYLAGRGSLVGPGVGWVRCQYAALQTSELWHWEELNRAGRKKTVVTMLWQGAHVPELRRQHHAPELRRQHPQTLRNNGLWECVSSSA